MSTAEDIARVKECLAYIQANPAAASRNGWASEVEAEARALGLLKPLAGRRRIDPKAAAYEGAILARQERAGIYD